MVRAIETRYAGYHFRSRLEARWAVFFDALDVEWEYEPEGYSLPSGYYLPDFFLPNVSGGLWFEVKPYRGYGADIDARCYELAKATGYNVVVAHGISSPDKRKYWPGVADGPYFETVLPNGDKDPFHCFCSCAKHEQITFEFGGEPKGGCTLCPKDFGFDFQFNYPAIFSAYAKARSARFEHGQSGPT